MTLFAWLPRPTCDGSDKDWAGAGRESSGIVFSEGFPPDDESVMWLQQARLRAEPCLVLNVARSVGFDYDVREVMVTKR